MRSDFSFKHPRCTLYVVVANNARCLLQSFESIPIPTYLVDAMDPQGGPAVSKVSRVSWRP